MVPERWTGIGAHLLTSTFDKSFRPTSAGKPLSSSRRPCRGPRRQRSQGSDSRIQVCRPCKPKTNYPFWSPGHCGSALFYSF